VQELFAAYLVRGNGGRHDGSHWGGMRPRRPLYRIVPLAVETTGTITAVLSALLLSQTFSNDLV